MSLVRKRNLLVAEDICEDICDVFRFDDIADTEAMNRCVAESTAAATLAIPNAEPKTQAESASSPSDNTTSGDATSLEAWCNVLRETTEQLSGLQQRWQADFDRLLLKLAVAISERIVRGQLDRQPEISLRWVREALELFSSSDRLRIYLHPEDRSTLGEQSKQLAGQIAPLASIEVVDDAGVERGGCRVESNQGLVDQNLSAQLARVLQELDYSLDL